MAGLLQGNPFYSGPSPLAAGVESFGDNLMKSYGFFQGMDQKRQEAAMQQQIMQQRLSEMQNQQKMRDELGAINQPTGLMTPAGATMAPPPQMAPMGDLGQGAMGPAMPTPGMGMAPMPAMQADPRLAPAPQASSVTDTISRQLAIIAKYDPVRATELQMQFKNASDKNDVANFMADVKNTVAQNQAENMKVQEGLKKENLDLRERGLAEQERNNRAMEEYRKSKGSGGGGEGGGKKTEFDRDYEDYLGQVKRDGLAAGVGRAFTRSEFRDYQMQTQAAAKYRGGTGSMAAAPALPSARPAAPAPKQTAKPAAPSTGTKNLIYNSATGKME